MVAASNGVTTRSTTLLPTTTRDAASHLLLTESTLPVVVSPLEELSKRWQTKVCLSGSQRDDARQGAWTTEESTRGEALAIEVRWRLPSQRRRRSHGRSGG
ncbi:hypothetical protein F2Q68_00010300 [Brassica cretica]|uniref:Uncharacterized protein n=1 Tax=Brassica cretica TaxID=69181 RepID=A0A8S9KRA6_BRACR|nr:hypothetical protein F2Q68_00010300 [Brassica cretica]